MAKQLSASAKPTTTPSAVPQPILPVPLELKPWTFLLYFCGDTTALKDAVKQDVEEVAKACKATLDQLHVVLQHDSPEGGARRYVGSGGEWTAINEDKPVRVNTGDPQEAIDFLEWGLKQAPSRHVAVIFSGQGIRKQYADEIHAQREIFERSKSASDNAKNRRFGALDVFSICHDESHHDALDVAELQSILQAATTLLDRPVDLVVFDAGCTAFIEIAYQLRNVARVMIAPRGLMPDSGLPYEYVLRACNQRIQKLERLKPLEKKRHTRSGQETQAQAESKPERAAMSLARVLGSVAAKATYPANEVAPELVVIDLQHTVATVQLIDYVAGTLLNHLGDWHVLNAVRRTGSFMKLMVFLAHKQKGTSGKNVDLPAVDLFRMLCILEANLESEERLTPTDFGQFMRLQHVRRVIRRARQELVPQRYLILAFNRLKMLKTHMNPVELSTFSEETNARWTDDDIAQMLETFTAIMSWFIGCQLPSSQSKNADVIPVWVDTYSPVPSLGLSILVPPAKHLDTDSTSSSASGIVRGSNYNALDFCRDASWTTFQGALQLIVEKPHAMWRLITSFLFSQNEQTRNSTLQRFLTSSNVLSGISEQFHGFRSDLAITLSLDVKSLEVTSDGKEDECGICRGKADREIFTLRLQGADGSPRIQENLSPIYRSTTQSALKSFELLLNSDEPADDAMTVLRQLGRSLGEDIIQALGEDLDLERQELARDASVAPHLRLQIPMHLMRYPWELMSDKKGLLFERFAMGRQFFTRSRAPQNQPRSAKALRVLVLGDPKFDDTFWKKGKTSHPQQLPGAVLEAEHVVELFRELRDDLEGIVEVWIEKHIECVITVNQVRDLIRSGQYDIIHYAGHACFNGDDPEGSAWLLSDGLLHSREIRNTLQWTLTPPWLVYANACEAGMEDAETGGGDGLRHYQGDVCGLGSAFTNHGIRGYVAPLWPINDDVALQLASDFYRGLLIKRFSLGEALFTAKQNAKDRLLGIDGLAQGSMLPAQVALSWASLVLYGDPSQRLFQSLWSGSASAQKTETKPPVDQPNDHFERRPPNNWRPDQSRRRFMPRIQQASARSIVNEMNGLGLTSGNVPRVRGADGQLAPQHKAVELVEMNGLRFWQVVDPETGKKTSLPGSNLRAQIESQEFKDRLGCNRGVTDYIRVIGTWAVNLVTGTAQDPLELQLARQFDKGLVPFERLVEVREDSTLATLRSGQWKPLAAGDRVVLLIHGTFSKATSPVMGFDFDANKSPSHFFRDVTAQWAKQNKTDKNSPSMRVIAYDHWTLSKSPLDNAADLAKALHDLDPQLLSEGRLDLIVHSRGGLVARSFVELKFEAAQEAAFPVEKRCAAVRRVIFIGTPNAGTQLANPVNAGRLADFLVNLAHLDEFGFFARMSGLLAQVVVHSELGKIPGLRAQNPNLRSTPGELLYRLHLQETSVFEADNQFKAGQEQKYWCVAANYEPYDDKGATDLTGIGEHLKAVGLDTAFDAFYDVTNDLVVDTHGVWAFREESQQMLDRTGPLPGPQVLLFNPTPAATKEPEQAQRIRAVRVHHCNLFMKREVRQFVQGIVLGK